MGEAKRKTLKTSTLTSIKGIGQAKAKKLFEKFDSLSEIQNASKEEIVSRGFSERDAMAIVEHFSEMEHQ